MRANQHKHAAPGGQPVMTQAIAAADARMAAAKHRFSLAALACLRGALDAEALVRSALLEVDEARAALRKAAEA